ncbi:hypothetical protein CAOG_002855 [Capsaspora owczarzaki ATCC 30864]|uniref:3-beta hydroxysteroid dehydrogenase/isomerase domain-containing protein n=1 Tax=Capsaspora owczarzaki (strain ATCC 30864) TaxID=595528 RepID=A0A0D2WM09_CAPO3|nr:hypothetical protein CAOG_002855 [Capsaspora owczarzaki ATCC 30864]
MSAAQPRVRSKLPPTLDCHGRTFALTGGGGYFGRRLCSLLLRNGASAVHLFDMRIVLPTDLTPDQLARIKTFEGDIRDSVLTESCFRGVDVVFHIASYGMSGKEQLQHKLIYAVNVLGTESVLQAAKRCKVKALVYTSTTNVIFCGKPIINGDETLPYCDLALHTDNYSRTKSIAEKRVLEVNGSPFEESSAPAVLKTCALRAAGIYGENEERHFPRIVGIYQGRPVQHDVRSPTNRVEFVYVDNLAEAHILAANSLLAPPGFDLAAGQAYFISDGEPVNNFEFMRPLVEGLGYKYPTLVLPYTLVFYMAMVIEWTHYVVGRFYNFQPLLTRTEVNKTGVTHFFSIDKARHHLAYVPRVTPKEGMRRLVASFVEKEERERRALLRNGAPAGSFSVFAGVTFAAVFLILVLQYVMVVRPEMDRLQESSR